MPALHFVFRPGTRRLLCAALALVFSSSGAVAATDAERIAELEKKLEMALKQMQQLGDRLREVEGNKAPAVVTERASPPVAEPAALATKVDALEQQVSAMANRPEPDHGLAMHGFADVGFTAASKGRPTGGNIGALDFYLTPSFGDRVKALFELNFEVDTEGHVGVDVERLQVGYTLTESSTLWAGRFHTPYGYWNTAFHHGAQLQTGIRRPIFLDFEDGGGILPAHTVGLWFTGSAKTDSGRASYDLYVGNSPSIQMEDATVAGSGTLDPGLSGALNRSATFGANLAYAFKGSLTGLSLGVHGLTSDVLSTRTTPDRVRLKVLGGWMAYAEDDWEIMAEYYGFRNQDLAGSTGTHASRAAYLQVGRQFGTWTPFARYETTRLDQADPYFAEQSHGQSYKRSVVGLRLDLNPKTAVKLEANRTSLEDRTIGSYSELRGQFAVRF
jgi:hypothetical protein